MEYRLINDEFLAELFKSSLTSKSILDIVSKHLHFHYISNETYKKLFEKIITSYQLTNDVPTIGTLAQDFTNDENVSRLLVKIKSINVSDKKDILLQTFEKFLVNVKFIDLYSKIGRLYNEGKQDKAINLLEQEASVIANFTIKDSYYSTVFNSFESRQIDRQSNIKSQVGARKVPFSIHCLDEDTRGGMDKGTSTLFMARSGRGKSTAMRWIAMAAARIGYRVAHFQQEGTEKDALDAYDSGWTSVDLSDIEFGHIPKDKIKLVEKANKDIIASGGEIYIKAANDFEEMSINDCRELLIDMEKIHGKFDLVIFDYLEIFTVRGKYFNSESGERKRREDIANRMTGIATEFDVAVVTATQANDIRPELYNNPDFVLTRSHISEFKGAIKPFSNFITINMTDDEYDNNMIRLYSDKFRKYKSGKTHRICSSFNNSRFYDAKKTLNLFYKK